MKKIVIVGIGRKAKEVKSFIKRHNLYEIIGFSVNREYLKESSFEGLSVYPLEELDSFIDKSEVYTYAASAHFNYMHRIKRILYDYLKQNGYMVANLISPLSEINTDNIGDGNWINDYVYIDEKSKIGSNNVFDKYAYIAHYNTIGNHNFFGIRTITGGSVEIGNQCFLGLGAIVFNSVIIGNKCIIGAGTVIKKHVKDYCLCKVQTSNIEVYQYDSETIEQKLAPTDDMKTVRKAYDTIKKE